ncbi:hypothetical protein FISHEDRAFT_59749 [Fistulina hepatica ATCC 64428]|uniref:Uncharacterized protein n=1 Tax=Fistulina hepatica ATCC 64428 TaxID=1128425 RepID=A0A0D7A9J1_9AGAR|nr:hypothetical protein FISHEDRAFT_59749 [Fistulina hepatica ATCC 64428]
MSFNYSPEILRFGVQACIVAFQPPDLPAMEGPPGGDGIMMGDARATLRQDNWLPYSSSPIFISANAGDNVQQPRVRRTSGLYIVMYLRVVLEFVMLPLVYAVSVTSHDHLLRRATTVSSTPTAIATTSTSSSSKLSAGAITGVVVGVICFIIILLVAGSLFLLRRSNARQHASSIFVDEPKSGRARVQGSGNYGGLASVDNRFSFLSSKGASEFTNGLPVNVPRRARSSNSSGSSVTATDTTKCMDDNKSISRLSDTESKFAYRSSFTDSSVVEYPAVPPAVHHAHRVSYPPASSAGETLPAAVTGRVSIAIGTPTSGSARSHPRSLRKPVPAYELPDDLPVLATPVSSDITVPPRKSVELLASPRVDTPVSVSGTDASETPSRRASSALLRSDSATLPRTDSVGFLHTDSPAASPTSSTLGHFSQTSEEASRKRASTSSKSKKAKRGSGGHYYVGGDPMLKAKNSWDTRPVHYIIPDMPLSVQD